MLPNLEGERISLLSDFLHEEFLHWCFGCVFTCRWIHLDTLDPDVSPEGQPHNVQVIASIAEGASKVDKHCKGKKDITFCCTLLGSLTFITGSI